MKFSTGKIVVFLALLTGVTLLPACRNKKSATESKNFNHPDCLKTSLWKKVDTQPGADPSVPDSLGGNGFEKIAESMGFLTYTPIEDEKKYFGDPRATTGGEFNVIMGQFPATLRPEGENSNSVYNTMIKGAVYEALLAQHPLDNRDIPALASHWRISPDKMTYTFRIDPNARFSDGNPVTAEDVVASWKLLMDEGLNEPSNLIVYGKYEQPVALSKYLVQVKFSLYFTCYAYHVSKRNRWINRERIS
jgi:ABC-type transport system substrate-binding protein